MSTGLHQTTVPPRHSSLNQALLPCAASLMCEGLIAWYSAEVATGRHFFGFQNTAVYLLPATIGKYCGVSIFTASK